MSTLEERFDGADMTSLETFFMPIVDEYDSELGDKLAEGGEDVEELVRGAEELESEIFGDTNLEDVVDDGLVASSAIVVAESNVGSKFMDYKCLSDITLWAKELDEMPLVTDDRLRKDILYKGKRFTLKEDLVHACQLYNIQQRREYRVVDSDTKLLNLKCRHNSAEGEVDKCPWHLRAMKKHTYFVITVYEGPHTCTFDILPTKSWHLTADFIAFEIKSMISESLRLPPRIIKTFIRDKHSFEITYWLAWKAREVANEQLWGEWKDSFSLLPHYMEELLTTNPGSAVVWKTEDLDDHTIQVNGIFWSFAPAIEAFKHCRPVLSIDGTFLYGKWQGVLMVAVGLDANNHILPLAFALVGNESVETWNWFMACIREKVTSRHGLTVISDRHPGIMNTMRTPEWSPPRAYHRVCVRHFVSNFMTQCHNTDFKELLAETAYQNQYIKFQKGYEILANLLREANQQKALEWLNKVPEELWSLAKDEDGRRWGSLTTNASECFNRVLKNARDLPITALIHYTFKQTNDYFTHRRELYSAYKIWAPKVDALMKQRIRKAATHRVAQYLGTMGQVYTARSNHHFEVDLEKKTCTCGKWTAFHYPCTHVLAVCQVLGKNITETVDPHYKMEYYRNTWAPPFTPIRGKQYWKMSETKKYVPNPQLRKPKKRGPGNKTRRHNEMDVKRRISSSSSGQCSTTQPPTKPSSEVTQVPKKPRRTITCTKCKEPGHNKASCAAKLSQ